MEKGWGASEGSEGAREIWAGGKGWRRRALTEEGRQVGHRLQEGPGLDLPVRGQRLEQVLGQQRHFGVEALGDAPARAEGVRARAVAARRLPGRQRRHFRPRLSASAERRPQAGAMERSAPPLRGLYQ